MRVIISGGGTGGHIFPAIAIADALKEVYTDIDIKFVGAIGRMEMEKVPLAGYEIEGLPISGFQRRITTKNLELPFKILKSILMARRIIKVFKPDVVVGVGGYASGPMLKTAQRMKIPTVIQEQNSYAGVTNKLLAKSADAICVAYDNMERFFPADKLLLTGNPVRKNIIAREINRTEANLFFGLDPNKNTILLFGGSLGAKSLNDSVRDNFEAIKSRPDVQLIWQVGGNGFEEYKSSSSAKLAHVKCVDFIFDMDQAYAASDIVICRAGALTISELCIVGKASILVPSPYVAEDHQTKNALALVNQHAALIIKDSAVKIKLFDEAYHLIDSKAQRMILEKEIKKLAKPNAVEKIVKIISSVSKK